MPSNLKCHEFYLDLEGGASASVSPASARKWLRMHIQHKFAMRFYIQFILRFKLKIEDEIQHQHLII